MTSSILDRPEVRAQYDPVTGVWDVGVGGRRFRVREWTWGERRRLVDSCVRGRVFLRERFVRGLAGLLVSPSPGADETPVLAAVALRLLGVEPVARPAPLLTAEALLASTWGWGPAELDAQPASRIDRHLAAISSAPVETSGWHSIEVVDD